MEITKVLLSNYLPYAKGTIIGRAIPSIDGLKPSQRRLLYTMYKMGLLKGNKTKSSNIVGQTMKLHPHGDMAIYESMVRMASGNESLNVPYIESKGNFGKTYSKDLTFASPRYTEAKLASICEEIFDGIEEGAVEFINNYDDTTKEPTLLPTKFPTILVNTSSGIAVGTSSNIPSFALANVCNSTIGIIDGSIKNVDELMGVLGQPEFTTGGHVHADKQSLNALGERGKGTFVISGSVVTYPNSIVINEIPYRTNAEAIINAIEEHVKSGELKEITNVSDEIDLNGFKLVIELKKGAKSSDVLNKLCRLTSLRMSMSFVTRVIIKDKCEELGILKLIEHWISFRLETINRIYKFRYDKAYKQAHLLEAWEKIKDNIKEVAELIAKTDEINARLQLMKMYELDEKQVDYLLDMKIKMFTQDNLKRKLDELETNRNNMEDFQVIISSDGEKRKIIIADLERIRDKYSNERKTQLAQPIIEQSNVVEEPFIDDTVVNVILTKSGYLKRLISLKDISNFGLPAGEEEVKRWAIKNNDHLLVFTYSGEVHKILVDSIDASKSGLKDKVNNILHIADEKQILFIDNAGDYSGYFNIVYPNGRGARVYYSKASGTRSKYKSVFEPSENGKLWITQSDKFFMITTKRKAAYCDLSLMGKISNRVAFKVARVGSNDTIFGLQPLENVPDVSKIDLTRYNKEYCVSIGSDKLW